MKAAEKIQEPSLTPRQRDIHDQRSRGMSWAEIARGLNITRGAVWSHYQTANLKIQDAGHLDRNRKELLPSLRSGNKTGPTAKHLHNLRMFVADLGLPRGFEDSFVRRLKALSGLPIEVETNPTTASTIQKYEKVQNLALEMLDEFTMSQASAKDLAQIAATSTDKIQLLKGQPTQILSHQDRRDLGELKQAILAEMDRREKIIDVTPETAG